MGDLGSLLLSPWSWLSLAALAGALELLIPGVYLIWVALAAFLTALTAAILNLTLDGVLTIFAMWVVVALLAAQRWNPSRRGRTDDPLLNRRGARVVGMRVEVTEAIENGRGRVRLGDSDWTAEGPDAPVGREMQVTAASGSVLTVAPIAGPEATDPQQAASGHSP